MRINAISVQNFRGILTDRTLVDSKEYGGSYDGWNDTFEPSTYDDTYEREYYPFADESPEYTKRLIAPYKETEHSCGNTTYNNVIVKPALKITKSKFMQYINDNLFSAEDARIRDMFLRSDLKCFTKENFAKHEDDYTIL